MTSDLYDHNCRRCTLNQYARAAHTTICVPGDGHQRADIMLIGEGPGAEEERAGRPFVGNAGRVLDEALGRAGLDRDSVFTDNTVRCRPPNNRVPHKDEVAACTFFTARMIEAVQPKVIVALGGSALSALTGIAAIGKSRGKVLKLRPEFRYECAVIASYHPASGFHSGSSARVLADITSDLMFARRLIGDASTTPENIVVGLEVEHTKEAMRTLARCDWLSCDAEWEVLHDDVSTAKWPWVGLKSTGQHPRLVAVGICGEVDGNLLSVSVPAYDEALMSGMRKLLARVPTVYHQSIADLCWLYANGFDVKLGGDTLLLGAVLNLETSLSLEAMASLFTDVRPDWKRDAGVAIVNGRKHVEPDALLGRWPFDPDEWRALLEYNARDCIATHKLNARLNEIAALNERGKVVSLYQEVLLPATEALATASVNGAPVDMALFERANVRADQHIARLVQEVADKMRLPDSVAESTVLNDRRLGAELLRQGVQLPMSPKNHVPSVTKDTLAPYVGKHPAIKPLLKLRGVRKQKTTYLEPWYTGIVANGDGRLHSIYKPTGARSGRTSAESDRKDDHAKGRGGAHMQNFPHDAGMRKLIRARDGHKIVVGDESQVEIRVAAWLSGERTMIRFMQERVDMHTVLAAWMKALPAGVDVEEFRKPDVREYWMAQVSKDDRYKAKPGNFGLLYGGSEEVLISLARMDYGVELTKTQGILMKQGYFLLYPDLPEWHERQWMAVQRGYCVSPLGRVRDLNKDDPGSAHRQAINTPVQNTANDLALAASRKAMRFFKREGLWNNGVWYIGYVHDSMMFEAADKHVALVASVVKDALEAPDIAVLGVEIPVPLVGDIEVGQSWGEAEPYTGQLLQVA